MWVCDLTTQGIHPNPGPVAQDWEFMWTDDMYVPIEENTTELEWFCHWILVRLCGYCREDSMGGSDPGPKDKKKNTRQSRARAQVAESSSGGEQWEDKEIIRQNMENWYGDGEKPCVNAYLGRECKHKGTRGELCNVQRKWPRQQPPHNGDSDGKKTKHEEPVKITDSIKEVFSFFMIGAKLGSQFQIGQALQDNMVAFIDMEHPRNHKDYVQYHAVTTILLRMKLLPSCCSRPGCGGVLSTEPFSEVRNTGDLINAFLVASPDQCKTYFQAHRNDYVNLVNFVQYRYGEMLNELEPGAVISPDIVIFQAAASKLSYLFPNVRCCAHSCGANLEKMPCLAPTKLTRMEKPPENLWDKVELEDQITVANFPRVRVHEFGGLQILPILAILAVSLVAWFHPEWFNWHWWLYIVSMLAAILLSTTTMSTVSEIPFLDRIRPLANEIARIAEDKRLILTAAAVGFQKERETFFRPHILCVQTVRSTLLGVLAMRLEIPRLLMFVRKLETYPFALGCIISLLSFPWAKVEQHWRILCLAITLFLTVWRRKLSKNSIIDLTTYTALNSPEILMAWQTAASYKTEVDNFTRKLASVLIPASTIMYMRNGDNIVNHTKEIAAMSFLARKQREDWFSYLNSLSPRRSGALWLALQAMGTFFGLTSMATLLESYASLLVVATASLVFLDWILIITQHIGTTFFLWALELILWVLPTLVLIRYQLMGDWLAPYIDMLPAPQWQTYLPAGNCDVSCDMSGARDTLSDAISRCWTFTTGCWQHLTLRLRRPFWSGYTYVPPRDTFGSNLDSSVTTALDSMNLSSAGFLHNISTHVENTPSLSFFESSLKSREEIQESENSTSILSSSMNNMVSSRLPGSSMDV